MPTVYILAGPGKRGVFVNFYNENVYSKLLDSSITDHETMNECRVADIIKTIPAKFNRHGMKTSQLRQLRIIRRILRCGTNNLQELIRR